ncbi:MAG: hypothetical protein ACE5IY_11435 [bacterium]
MNVETGNWLSLTTEDGLVNNWVQAVVVCHFNHQKTIWFGTRKGVSVLEPRKMSWHHDTGEEGMLPDDWITALAVDEVRGFVWVGTAKGLARYNLEGRHWAKVGRFTSSMWIVDLIIENETGNVWCATLSQGIKKYDSAQAKWSDVLNTSKPFHTLCMHLDERQQTLWLGTDDGLWAYHPDANKSPWKKHSPERPGQAMVITSMQIDEQLEKGWFATDRGIYEYELQARTWTSVAPNIGLVHNDVNALALDEPSDSIWFATDGGGISRYDLEEKAWETYTREEGLFSLSFKSADMSVKDKALWFGSSQAVGVLYPDTKQIARIGRAEGLDDAAITAIAIDEQREVAWIGAWGREGGLYRYDLNDTRSPGHNYTYGLAHRSVTSIAVAGDRVWVGTGAGVSRYNTKTDDWRTFTTEDGLSNSAVITLARDGKHRAVWAATEWGLNCYDERQERWHQFFKTENGLAHNIVLAIAIDEDNDKVWFGTEGFGVTCLDLKTNTWETFTTRDGLANNYVLSIVLDKKRNCTWFGTLMGGASRLCDR